MVTSVRIERPVVLEYRSVQIGIPRDFKLIPADSQTVAIIDATDLPAAPADKKKTGVSGRRKGAPWGRERARPATQNFMSRSKSIRCASSCGRISTRPC